MDEGGESSGRLCSSKSVALSCGQTDDSLGVEHKPPVGWGRFLGGNKITLNHIQGVILFQSFYLSRAGISVTNMTLMLLENL